MHLSVRAGSIAYLVNKSTSQMYPEPSPSLPARAPGPRRLRRAAGRGGDHRRPPPLQRPPAQLPAATLLSWHLSRHLAAGVRVCARGRHNSLAYSCSRDSPCTIAAVSHGDPPWPPAEAAAALAAGGSAARFVRGCGCRGQNRPEQIAIRAKLLDGGAMGKREYLLPRAERPGVERPEIKAAELAVLRHPHSPRGD